MTNKEIVARLAELGEKASVKERKTVLEEKLAKAEAKATMNTQEETKEENTMKDQETKVQEQNVTSTKQESKKAQQAAERDAHIDMVIDTIDKGIAEADVYPNLGDWIKIKLGSKTVLEARFGKKDLRVQAAEDVAKEAGVTYKLVMSFSKPATIFLQYNADGMSQLEALIGAADTVAAEKQAEKEAKEMEKMLAKEAAKAAKKAAKAAANEKKEEPKTEEAKAE